MVTAPSPVLSAAADAASVSFTSAVVSAVVSFALWVAFPAAPPHATSWSAISDASNAAIFFFIIKLLPLETPADVFVHFAQPMFLNQWLLYALYNHRIHQSTIFEYTFCHMSVYTRVLLQLYTLIHCISCIHSSHLLVFFDGVLYNQR